MRLPVSRPRSWLHAALALVLAATFGARVAAAPATWGCPTGEEQAAGHHEHGHHAPGSPAPTCICIAHGSGIGLAVEPPQLLGSASALPSVFRPGISDDHAPLVADRHVLPFPIGPPTLLA